MNKFSLDEKYQDFLDLAGIGVSSYGVRTFILGNLIGMEPKSPEEVHAQLLTLFKEGPLSPEHSDRLFLLIKDLWLDLDTQLNQKELPLLSPILSEQEVDDLIYHLAIRQEEIANFLMGVNLGEGFIDDDEEHEDVMDRLELFTEEVDDLMSDMESAPSFDEYQSDLEDMIKESEEIWNDAFQVLFDII